MTITRYRAFANLIETATKAQHMLEDFNQESHDGEYTLIKAKPLIEDLKEHIFCGRAYLHELARDGEDENK